MLAQLRVRQRTASAQSTSSLETSMTSKGILGIFPTKCSIIDSTCHAVAAAAGGNCAAGTAEVVGECMIFGLGPEDPLSDICAVAVAAAWLTACNAGGGVDGITNACESAAGCGLLLSQQNNASVSSAGGQDACPFNHALAAMTASTLESNPCILDDVVVKAGCGRVFSPEEPFFHVCTTALPAAFTAGCKEAEKKGTPIKARAHAASISCP